MSIMVEELAKREMELLEAPDQVRLQVRVSCVRGFYLPDSDGDKEEAAVFKVLTFGDNTVMERVCAYQVPVGPGQNVTEYDVHEMRRLFVKRNLLEWSLPVPIERENGWMTKESYQRVSRVSAPLLEAFLDKFEDHMAITKTDEEKMSRQASVLFSKNSHGVADACEAVRMFCTLGNFWEKFGLTRHSIMDLPYREYVMLKMMMGKESESIKRESRGNKPRAQTKIIAGHGGRVRPSQAVVVPGTG
jgi:hypothetical protein